MFAIYCVVWPLGFVVFSCLINIYQQCQVNLGGTCFKVAGVFLLAPRGLLQGMLSYFSGWFTLPFKSESCFSWFVSKIGYYVTLRGENGELRVGVRRAMRKQDNVPSSVISSHSMHLGVLATAWHAISTGTMFTVYYKPRCALID